MIGTTAILVICGLIVAGTWIDRYDPFTKGASGWKPSANADARWMPQTWTQLTGFQAFRVPVRQPHTTFIYRFSLMNSGSVSLTLKSVGPLRYTTSIVPVAMIPDVNKPTANHTTPPFEPFRPFTLGPGQEAAIAMRVTTSDCLGRGVTLSPQTLPITFRVLGFTRHTWFSPDPQFMLYGAC